MDEIISQFFTAGTVVLTISVVIGTFFIRRTVETAMPTLQKKADENAPGLTYETRWAIWYQKVILYAIPVIVGALIGLVNVPYLFSGLSTKGECVFFGAVVGWLSSYLYKIVRQMLKKKTGVDLDPSASMMPGASSVPPESQ